MPIFILLVGLILIVTGINNKIPDLIALVKEDFSPSDNSTSFPVWIFAIFVVGALGYIKPLKGLSIAFLFLIIIAMFVKKDNGFFDSFSKSFLKGNSNE
jgi:hypothetical protein